MSCVSCVFRVVCRCAVKRTTSSRLFANPNICVLSVNFCSLSISSTSYLHLLLWHTLTQTHTLWRVYTRACNRLGAGGLNLRSPPHLPFDPSHRHTLSVCVSGAGGVVETGAVVFGFSGRSVGSGGLWWSVCVRLCVRSSEVPLTSVCVSLTQSVCHLHNNLKTFHITDSKENVVLLTDICVCWLTLCLCVCTEWPAVGLCSGPHEAFASATDREEPQWPHRPGECVCVSVCKAVNTQHTWTVMLCFMYRLCCSETVPLHHVCVCEVVHLLLKHEIVFVFTAFSQMQNSSYSHRQWFLFIHTQTHRHTPVC